MFSWLFSNLIVGKKKWTEIIKDVSSGSILKSVCWGFYLVFILFLRKCCSAFKLRVWINLFCRISVGGNLSPDSGSMIANTELPISVLLHARSAGQGQQICWNQDFKLRSWIKETWFSAATLNFYVLSVCSFLSLSVAVCGFMLYCSVFVKTVIFFVYFCTRNVRVLQREVGNQSVVINF